MKTSIISSKSKYLFLALLLPVMAEAKLVAKIHAIKGDVFVVRDGKTTSLKDNVDLAEGAQIMVGDDSSATIGDFHDRRYHLAEGTNFVVQDRSMKLLKGGVWTQSVNSKSGVTIASANMMMSSHAGEFIATYDPATKKSQLTVVSGEVDVASPLEPAFRYAVTAGQFSHAMPTIDDGYPRAPTRIGYDSLMKTVGMFPNVKSLDEGLAKVQAASRNVASTEPAPEKKSAPEKEKYEQKGEIVFMKTVIETSRKPASTEGEAQKYFLASTKRPAHKAKVVLSTAKVRVIGYQAVSATSSRNPASLHKIQTQERAQSVSAMELLKSYEERIAPKSGNSQEVQRLIDDLNSY